MRTVTLHLILYVLVSSCASSSGDRAADSAKLPNILLIVTDDQGWGDLGINGNPVLHTPVLDKLAGESIRFDRFYVCPVCAPTRASLLTGRYHLRTGTSWVTHRKEVMRASEVTLAELLRDAGYVTGCFGKWHNGEQYPNNPNGQGFDEFFGFCAGHWNNYFNTELEHNGRMEKTTGYITDVITDKTVEFIKKNRNTPFFCYVPFNAPHSPFQVPDRYFTRYSAKGMNNKDATVYGMCENIDDNVGKLLYLLDSLKISDNTMVLFFTDNGPNGQRYNGEMKGWKGHVDEGGIRVPLFIKYPARFGENGRIITELTSVIDILPTITELCRIPLPDTLEIDGRSLVPLLEKSGAGWMERNIYTHQVQDELRISPASVRNNRYRLVFYENRDTLLYDMIKDPGQETDISGQNAEIVREMLNSYTDWFSEVTKNGLSPPPVPAGYPGHPVTNLPAPEAKLSGNIRFKGGRGWANDWILNWKDPADKAEWQTEIVHDGEFEILVKYALDEENAGCTMEITVDSQKLEWVFDSPATAETVLSPDRVKRTEVYERLWNIQSVGKVNLVKGLYSISFRFTSLKGNDAFELKSLILRQI